MNDNDPDEFFASAKLHLPAGKVPVLLTVDEEIAEWFRQQDGDFRRNMSEALKDYARSHR